MFKVYIRNLVLAMLVGLMASSLMAQTTVISEDFSGFTTGTHDSPSTSDISASLDTYTQTPGWTGLKIYSAAGEIKVGSSSALGYIITPTIDLSANGGAATIKLKIQCWTTCGDGAQVQVLHAPDGTTFTQVGSNFTPTSTKTEITAELTAGGTVNSKIKITTTVKRSYFDDIIITQATGGEPDPEPTNHVTAFSAGSVNYNSIELDWTGSVGDQLPSGYLLLGKKGAGTFASVADETAVANDADWADNNFAVNLAHVVGANTYTLNGLTDNTQYDFKIYAYTNSGASIDFKTDGTIPAVSATTPVAPLVIESEDFTTCPSADWLIVNQDGDNKLWACSSNSMLANGFGATPAGSVSNDWLISPALNLDNYTDEILTFQTKTQYTGPALKCKYSVDYAGSGDPGVASWTELSFTAATTTTFVSSGEVDLSSVNGSSVYIAFHYTSTGTLSGEAANWWVDNVLLTGFENINTNDQDSKVEAPVVQVAAFDISSTIDTEIEAVEVFKFKIHDLGTADTEPTLVTKIKIVPGASNTALWSTHIAGVELWKTTEVTTGTPVISDTEISFPVSAGNLSIASGSADELVLKVYLKTTVTDGGVLQFSIPSDSHGFTSASSGSGFAADFGLALNSNTIGIEVTATKLAIETPLDFTPNSNFAVTVRAKDDNNNTDADQSVSVTLSASGSGSLSSATGLVQNLSSGMYVWNDVRYSAEESFTITATAIGFDAVQSAALNPAGNIPAGYYDAAAGKTGAELKTALYTIIDAHTIISYDGLWTAYQTTDVRSDGKVWDMYSNCTFTFVTDQCGEYSAECDCYNREHSMPKSWFNDVSPMNSDAFMVVPTDGYVNGVRGNYAFGEVGTADYTSGNGCKRGDNTYPGYTGTVFEPADEFKGDFARIYFYMATRYENVISGWENFDNDGDAMLDGTSYPCFEPWALNMLLEWNAADPVSQKEIDRNNAIYALQDNRNPFVDHPEWVSSIWSSTSCVPPSTQASAFASSNITQNSATVSWTRGNGNAVLVLAYQGGPVNSNPVDGASYSADAAFGSGSVIGTGNYVVYNGTGNSVNLTGLNFGTTYHFAAYEYNTDGNCFNTTPLTGNITTLPKDEPSNHATSFATGEVAHNSITLSWVDAAGGVLPDYYLVRWSSVGFANIPVPADGTSVANNDSVLNVAIGVQGTTFIGLAPDKTYYFKIFPYSNTGINIDFKTDGFVPEISATTSTAPSGGIETFDNLTAAGSYVTGTFAGQDGSTWNYVKCRGDVEITAKAIMLGKNQSPASEFYSGTLSGGISNISFDYMKAYTTDANFRLLVNNEVIQVFTSADEGVVKNSGNIAVNVSGDVVIKFNQVNTSSGQVVIDNISWTGFADATPPVATFAPENNATGISLDTTVKIIFNEAVRKADGSELTDSDVAGIVQFKKNNAGGEAVAYTGTISADKKTISLVPDANLMKSTVYFVVIAENTIEDNLGNEMAAQSASFTTIHPTISITAPTENQIFNQGAEMNLTWTSQYVDSVHIRIYIQSELLHNANVLASLGSYLYSISSTATQSGLYSVKMYDKLDAEIGDTVIFRVNDVTPPQISALLPLNGAVNQTLSGTLVLTSNESLQKGTGNIEIYTSANVLALQIDVQDVSLNGFEITVPYTGLSGQTSYYVKIASGVLVDQGGNSLLIDNNTTWAFSTHETIAPVLTFDPEDAQTGVLINSLLTISFNEPVRKLDNSAIENSDLAGMLSLKLTDVNGADVSFVATINPGKTVITLDPVENLLGEQLYYFAIDAELEDGFNNGIAAQSVGFTTADANMPYVNISPIDGALDVDVAANVVFVFNEAIRMADDSEITAINVASLVSLKIGDTTGENIAFTASVNAEKTEITLNPDANLVGETVYYAAFLAGAEDFQENPVSPEETYFTTMDITAPTVAFDPLNGANNVADDAIISLTFTEAVRKADNSELTNQDLVNYLVFKKTDSNGEAVAFSASINVEKKVITIDPENIFNSEQMYYVGLLAGLEDAANNAVIPVSATFTSEDNIFPQLVFVPENAATNVDDESNLEIHFSEPIRKADNNELISGDLTSYLTLKKTNASGTAVDFTATINENKDQITINPTNVFESEQVYYMAIGAGLEDKNNNAVSPASISFTSEDNLAPVVSFIPEDGASLVLVGQNLSFIFTEHIYKSGGLAIETGDVNAMVEFRKTDVNGENVAYVVSVTDTSFVLTPVETLLYNQLYYIALKSDVVYDLAGNVCVASDASFTTQLEPVNNHETFDNLASGTSYVSGSFVGQDGSLWSFTSARGDQTIDGKAICFQNSGNPYLLSGTLHYGIKSLSVKHQQKFTGSGGKIIAVEINGNNILTGDVPVTTTLDTFLLDNINVTGDFTLKIITNGASRIAIDDIEWISLVPVSLIQVTAQDGLETIEADGGSLQMTASVYPTNASNKLVNWSVENLTGSATISESGLLTAVSDGTVRVRATAQDGSGISGSLDITVSNQTIPVVSVEISSSTGLNEISLDNGTLQINAVVLPENATNPALLWSVLNVTGVASVDQSGLLTAIANGLVRLVAIAQDGSEISDTLDITIANQIVTVETITVSAEGGLAIIDTDNGVLQMTALVEPVYANNPDIIWSVENQTGMAGISEGGLLTALTNGTVLVKATATDGSGVFGTKQITISNQVVPVENIVVSSQTGNAFINTDDGDIQMLAEVSPVYADDASFTWSVENQTGMATVSQTGLLTAVTNGTVLVKAAANDGSGVFGSLQITLSNQFVAVETITLSSATGINGIDIDNGTLQINSNVLPVYASNKALSWTVIYGTGVAVVSQTGLVRAIAGGTVTIQTTATDGSGIIGTIELNLTNQIDDTLVSGIEIQSQGNLTVIDTDDGTLQLFATVTPDYASIQTVTWSIQNGTGYASIDSDGLVTALANGTVIAIATADDGSNVSDEFEITISNQVVSVETVTVGSVSDQISVDNGTLQMEADVLPVYADDITVTWSVENQTGIASIDASGLLTAIANGNVLVKATSNNNTNIFGTKTIHLSNQIVLVESVVVSSETSVDEINVDNGTLQMEAAIEPLYATSTDLVWSIENQTGMASISQTGLVTAIKNGSVLVKATATDSTAVQGILPLTISNQIVPVESITVSSVSGSDTIVVDNGTLQMQALVLPAYADDLTLTWSVVNQTGMAGIDQAGMLTAITNGTVLVKATSNDGSGVFGTMQVTISNQFVPVESISVNGFGNATEIAVDNGTLQMTALVNPVYATNSEIVWSVENQTGIASINASGLLTAIKNGTVLVKATATDGSAVFGSLQINLINQVIPVESIVVSSVSGSTTISADNGTLQMQAAVNPDYATNPAIVWSVENQTGMASINQTGLLTAIVNGNVLVKATASDGTNVFGSIQIGISNQIVLVESILVSTPGSVTEITTDNGTLQMSATVSPVYASNVAVVWSIENQTGIATISATGLVTAVKNGTILVKATASDVSGIQGTMQLTLSNQFVPVLSVTVSSQTGLYTIDTDNGTLQMQALVLPDYASDPSISWSVEEISGEATISSTGLLTAVENGIIEVIASATDGSGVFGSRSINISNQLPPDTQAPTFISPYPQVVSVSQTAASVEFKMDEPGEIFWMLRTTNLAPGIAELLQTSPVAVSEANTVVISALSDLTPVSSYYLFIIARDDEVTPNVQANITLLSFVTTGYQPSIETQPQGLSLCPGSDATFAVEATGSAPITFAWYFNNLEIENEDQNSLLISNISAADAGNYFCKVSNAFGEINSDTVSLTLKNQVEISVQPVPVNLCSGSRFEVSVEATGNDIVYQWFKNQTEIEDANSSEYSIQSVTGDDEASYKCRLSGECTDELFSSVADLMVSMPAVAGDDVILSVYDTLNLMDLNALLSSQATSGGNWYDAEFTLIENGIISPETMGEGNYVFLYEVANAPCLPDTALVQLTVLHYTGIAPNTASFISIYPNPAGEWFIVSLQDGTNGEIVLSDLHGKVLISKTLDGTGIQKIWLDNIPQGVYMVTVTSQKRRMVTSLIKR